MVPSRSKRYALKSPGGRSRASLHRRFVSHGHRLLPLEDHERAIRKHPHVVCRNEARGLHPVVGLRFRHDQRRITFVRAERRRSPERILYCDRPMTFPRRERSSSIRAPLAILVLALVMLGAGLNLWKLRQREAAPPSAPVNTSAPTAPTPTTAPDSASRSTASGETYDLAVDEAKGGHTLTRHVERTDAQLRERLDRERNISAASTYTDRAIAERTVARAFAREAARVSAWRGRSGKPAKPGAELSRLRWRVLGRTLRRGRSSSEPCTNAIVVLRWDGRPASCSRAIQRPHDERRRAGSRPADGKQFTALAEFARGYLHEDVIRSTEARLGRRRPSAPMPARTSVAPWQTISFNSPGAPAHGSHATSRVSSAGSRGVVARDIGRAPRDGRDRPTRRRQIIRLMPESEKPVVRSRAAHQRPQLPFARSSLCSTTVPIRYPQDRRERSRGLRSARRTVTLGPLR